jgi:hypothetical protein
VRPIIEADMKMSKPGNLAVLISSELIGRQSHDDLRERMVKPDFLLSPDLIFATHTYFCSDPAPRRKGVARTDPPFSVFSRHIIYASEEAHLELAGPTKLAAALAGSKDYTIVLNLPRVQRAR